MRKTAAEKRTCEILRSYLLCGETIEEIAQKLTLDAPVVLSAVTRHGIDIGAGGRCVFGDRVKSLGYTSIGDFFTKNWGVTVAGQVRKLRRRQLSGRVVRRYYGLVLMAVQQ